MAEKVIFVADHNKSLTFKFNMFGNLKNQVKVGSVLSAFKTTFATLEDGSVLEADDNGLSVDIFEGGKTYKICFDSREGKPFEHF